MTEDYGINCRKLSIIVAYDDTSEEEIVRANKDNVAFVRISEISLAIDISGVSINKKPDRNPKKLFNIVLSLKILKKSKNHEKS